MSRFLSKSLMNYSKRNFLPSMMPQRCIRKMRNSLMPNSSKLLKTPLRLRRLIWTTWFAKWSMLNWRCLTGRRVKRNWTQCRHTTPTWSSQLSSCARTPPFATCCTQKRVKRRLLRSICCDEPLKTAWATAARMQVVKKWPSCAPR